MMPIRVMGPGVSGTLRLLLIGLIVVATGLFVLGVTVERGSEPVAVPGVQQKPGESGAGGEAQEGGAAHVETPAAAGVTTVGEVHRELVLGVDLENPAVVVAIVAGWLLLLGGLFVLGRISLLLLALAALAATVFDLGEVLLQVNRANALVAGLAIAVAVAHAALFVLAGWAFLRSSRTPAVSSW